MSQPRATRRFEDAVILITGAGRGLGRLAAERFAAEGALLVMGDLGEEVHEVAAALAASGTRVEALTGDVAREETAQALVERAVDAFGRLDVAINNAGVAHAFARLPDTDVSTMERMLRVNVMGVFHGMRRQIPQMESQYAAEGRGGAILNVASVAGLVGAPLLAAYAAAKHAVVGLTRSAAVESARRGVRINALCPAFTQTRMVDEMIAAMRGTPDEALARIVTAVPMRRLAEPEEVVQAMLWACAPENGFMTGQAIALDGGLCAS